MGQVELEIIGQDDDVSYFMAFLRRLESAIPDCVVSGEVFPIDGERRRVSQAAIVRFDRRVLSGWEFKIVPTENTGD